MFLSLFIHLCLCASYLKAIDVSSDNNPYCKITPSHTLCLYQGGATSEACGRVVLQGVADEAERNLILDLHNKLRAKIANGLEDRGNPGPQPSAANMMELVWDKELEHGAQAWTNQCITNHDCPECRTVPRFKVGQNLYEFGHFSGSWERSVQGWYDEVVDFNNTFIDPFFIPKGILLGHFTQLIWSQTSKIGCGKLFFYPSTESKYGKQLFICNYGIGGNLIGSQLYVQGKSCSACPLGTTCSQKHPGLCSGEPDQPLTLRPPIYDPIGTKERYTWTIKPNPNPGEEPPFVIEPPKVPGKPDTCVYTCRTDGGCNVAFKTEQVFSGASMGSCFPPSFGGQCTGIPVACKPCIEPCKPHLGKIITVTLNQTGDPTIEEIPEEVTKLPTPSSGSATCHYNCQASGGCSVRIQSEEPISGNTMGSCFSQDFGGSCSGIPERCQECLGPCEGKAGEMLSLPAS